MTVSKHFMTITKYYSNLQFVVYKCIYKSFVMVTSLLSMYGMLMTSLMGRVRDMVLFRNDHFSGEHHDYLLDLGSTGLSHFQTNPYHIPIIRYSILPRKAKHTQIERERERYIYIYIWVCIFLRCQKREVAGVGMIRGYDSRCISGYALRMWNVVAIAVQ